MLRMGALFRGVTKQTQTLQKTGAGNDFLGWVSLPHEIPEALLQDIQQTANSLRTKSDVIVSIGIGGSYLGARAVIEAIQGPLAPYREELQILFAGHNISSWYLQDLLGSWRQRSSV
jgi:glucose-6-phosphate isomerase